MSIAPFQGVCPRCRHDHSSHIFLPFNLEVERLQAKVRELEAENAALRDQQEELLAELSGLIALIDYESLTLPARELMAKCMRQQTDRRKP